jgi:putative tryptophan/tyrosine transport system substrate-binding protein
MICQAPIEIEIARSDCPRRDEMVIVRREFLIGVGSVAAGGPLTGAAQPSALPMVGVLGSGSREAIEFPTSAFLYGLRDAGYVVSRNVAIEYRWGNGQYNPLRAMAADLVQRRAAVIVTFGGNPAAEVAKATSSTIPIVSVFDSDPVAAGLVPTLNRPGDNVTGVLLMNSRATDKRLALLHEVAPGAALFALLGLPIFRCSRRPSMSSSSICKQQGRSV